MNEEQVLQSWPKPPEDAIGKALHVLDAFDECGDDMQVVTATSNVYGRGVVTGLTLGDLRELVEMIGKKSL